jgi:hypothetical protein
MTASRFRPRRVPSNAARRRGIPGALDLGALCALASSKPPAPEATIAAGSGQVIPRIGGDYVR